MRCAFCSPGCPATQKANTLSHEPQDFSHPCATEPTSRNVRTLFAEVSIQARGAGTVRFVWERHALGRKLKPNRVMSRGAFQLSGVNVQRALPKPIFILAACRVPLSAMSLACRHWCWWCWPLRRRRRGRMVTVGFRHGRSVVQKAEAREDFDAAWEDYRQAHLKKPKDLRYDGPHFERVKVPGSPRGMSTAGGCCGRTTTGAARCTEFMRARGDRSFEPGGGAGDSDYTARPAASDCWLEPAAAASHGADVAAGPRF